MTKELFGKRKDEGIGSDESLKVAYKFGSDSFFSGELAC